MFDHMELETLTEFYYWRAILQRGQDKVIKRCKDPAGRAQLEAENSLPEPKPPHLLPPRIAASVSAPFPPCLLDTDSVSSKPPHSRNARRHSFLNFPSEIRNMIYQYCVDYPTCRQLYDTYYVQRDKQDNGKGKGKENAQVKPHLNTPTILLLCKRITREALGVLRSRYFILDRIPPWVMGNASPLPLIHFVSKTTLQNIKYFEFRVALGEGREGSGFIWIKVLRELLKVLSERNAVVEMKVMFTLKHIECWGLWLYELPGYERLTGMLNQWEFKHGHRPGTVQLEHWVIDYIYAYRTGFRNPLVRFYPDEVFWPGSVLEYL